MTLSPGSSMRKTDQRCLTLSLLLALSMAAIPGCLTPRDNPLDPGRCDPGCGAGERCFEGSCVKVDASVDMTRDQTPMDGAPDKQLLDAGLDTLSPDSSQLPPCKTGWQSPTNLTTNALNALWGSSATNIWIAGDKGELHHWDGSAWKGKASGTTKKIQSIWGSNWNNTYAVGEGGLVLHYNGSAWKDISATTKTTKNLSNVWGSSASHMFLIGEGVHEWDGSKWSDITSIYPFLVKTLGVWNVGKNYWFLRPGSGLYVSNLGSSGWKHWPLGSSISAGGGIWGTSTTNIFVVGGKGLGYGQYEGVVIHFNGTKWASMTLPAKTPMLYGVSGSGPHDVFAVGDKGAVLHFDGKAWTRQYSSTTSNLHRAWVIGNKMYAVSSTGVVIHHQGPWKPVETNYPLNTIWGSSASDIHAVGNESYIVHYDGSKWTLRNGPVSRTHLYGVWGSSPTNVFAVGAWYSPSSGGSVSPRAFRLDSKTKTWSAMKFSDTSGQIALQSLWGSGPDDVYAVGFCRSFGPPPHTCADPIYHYGGSGDTWERLKGGSGINKNLNAIWGASKSDIFAGGSGGVMYRYDGSKWTSMTSFSTKDIQGIWGRGSSDVFAVDSEGTVGRYDGSTWSTSTPGTKTWLNAVWGAPKSDVFIVGTMGQILHHNGTQWSTTISGTGGNLNGIWGSAPHDVYVVGTGGIFHWCGP